MDLPQPYTTSVSEPIPSENIQVANVSNIDPIYADRQQLSELMETKDQFPKDPRLFNQSRNVANPVEFLGNSIFMNRAAIKLANIDAVFNVTHHYGGMIKPQSEMRFRFCDLAGGPGSFTQYIQYRQRQASGFGITLQGPLDWKKELIDPTRFTYVYGPDNTGDLYTNWQSFYETAFALFEGDTVSEGNKGSLPSGQIIVPGTHDPTQFETNPIGYHLIVADGGIEIDDNYDRQEFLSTHLIIIEVLLALKLLMKDGHFVCKMFDTLTLVSAQLLYLVSQCFEEIYLFKPISSRPANAEQYLVAKVFKNNASAYLPILERAAHLITNVVQEGRLDRIVSLFDESLPDYFEQWLRQQNQRSLYHQQLASTNLLMASQNQALDLPKYDLHKFFIIWNLPDNPIAPNREHYKVPFKGAGNYRGKDQYEAPAGRGRGRGRGGPYRPHNK